MKRLCIILMMAVISAACTNASSTLNAKENTRQFDAAKEQQAILAVIEQETTSFFNRDYEGWKGTRAQKSYDFQGWNNADGTFDVENGWQQVNTGIRDYIEQNRIPITTKPEVLRRNMQCKFYGDSCAFLTWDEYTREDTSNVFYKSKDLRVMEKQSNDWKIVSVASFWDYKHKIQRESIR